MGRTSKKKPKKKDKKSKKDIMKKQVEEGLWEGTTEAEQKMIAASLLGSVAGMVGPKIKMTGSPHTKNPGIKVMKMNKGGPVDARKIAKKYFKGVF